LVAAARSVGKPPRAYQKWKPLAAGLQLMGDFTRAAKLKPDEPLDSIKAMARLAGVKMRPTGVYPAIPVARQIVKGYAPEAGLTCLEEAVNAVESGAEPIHTTSAAWARGDVRAAVRDARGEERCFYALPGVADLRRHAIKEEADVLQNALNTPGHAVAVLSLRSLVTQGGILEQLRARGVTVTSPTR
jgi:hypothetical protein